MTDAPTMRDRLQNDLKTAMRQRDENARDTIRYILSAIKNAEIDRGGALTEAEAISVLQKQAKQRQEAIEQFRSGAREDLATREEGQLLVLKRYLPEAMTDAEVMDLTRSVVAELGASGPKEMNKVMPVVMQRAAGRADGRRLSAAVKTVLAGS